MKYTSEMIRNIALIGHSGEGKTSLAEAMLFNAQRTERIGKIEDGTTVMDYDQEEIERKLSIGLAVASLSWKNTKINIIDAPGFFDFEGETYSALNAADSAIIVTSACGEVNVGTEKAIEKALNLKKSSLIFVSQINKENADFNGTVQSLFKKYPHKIAVVEIPILDDNLKMTGSILVLQKKAFNFDNEEIPVPDKYKDILEEVYTQLTELAAESSEELMDKYFSGEPLTREEIIQGVKYSMQNDGIILLMGGSGTSNRGVINLMNKIVDCMPNPIEVIQPLDINGAEIICDSSKNFVAQVFKSISDPFVGNLSLIKVLRGELKPSCVVLNANNGIQEKIGSLYMLKGKKQEIIESLVAGDIGALAKLTETKTSDTLCDLHNKVVMPKIEFPKANIYLAIYATKRGEEEKIAQGIFKMQDEDKTLVVERNHETKEMLIGGLGETQLAIVCKKLKTKFKVDANLQDPKIPYRETIKKTVTARGKYKKQSGGHGQYGDCYIRFEPYPDGDFAFDEEIVGGAIPKSYIPAIEKGLKECIEKGVLAGFPVVNLKAVTFDGSYHDVDSSEMAFKIAASIAYKKGLQEASPILLEPIQKVEIVVPEHYMGDILGDLNKRRGKILGMETINKKQKIIAEVPHAEMFKYSTDLRSMTQGRGTFSMEFLKYNEVPHQTAEKIISKANIESNE